MKKRNILLSIFVFISGLAFSQTVGIENLKREDYTITDDVITHSRSNKIWVLFIPVGGKSEEKRHKKALKKALKECDCDGLINPQYTERKIIIPLILVTFSHRATTIKGKGYKIKVG